MLDIVTNKPLTIYTEGNAGPYLMVPVQQLDTICQLLSANDVAYGVDENAISLNGMPEVTVVNLAKDTDIASLQRVLDES